MSPQITASLQPVQKFLSKHHSIIFISALCLGLAVAIYSLYDALNVTTSTSTNSTSTIGSFDQQTIEKIKNLQDSNDAADTVVFPTPRSNPFIEK